VPLSADHFQAADRLSQAAGGRTVIDVSFPMLAHLSADFIRHLEELVPKANILVFSHPWVYPLAARLINRSRQLIIYDSQNVEGLLRTQLLDEGVEGSRLAREAARSEVALCRGADLVLACSQEDRLLFAELYGIEIGKVRIVPNGTFTQGLGRATHQERSLARESLGIGEMPLAIFLGSNYPPNIEAANYICRKLAPAMPNVFFAICGGVGSGLPPETRNPINGQMVNLRVTGPLSGQDKELYLRAADIALNPMFSGSGTNVKIFDFMANGLPVLTTAVGARGIEWIEEPALEVAQAEEFADKLRGLLNSPEKMSRLGDAGRRLVERRYSWEKISGQLGQLLARHWKKAGSKRPFFSVVVPTWERHALLDSLVERLQAQTWRDFEVIIVDQSASLWPNRNAAKNIGLFYVRSDNRGAAMARNLGAFFARGHCLAFTDDDCQPTPNWLENAVPYFQRAEVVGIEGFISTEKRFNPNYRTVTNDGFEGLGFMTANLFIREDVFCRLGGFDERFDNPHFREDTDLGWRALDFGEVPFARDVEVFHPPHPRGIGRESQDERNRFFVQDALLMMKHPEKFRTLFLAEGHYKNTQGYWEYFLKGVEKYGARLDPFYERLYNVSRSRPNEKHA
jgi:glycosyltransferase involved in cell wall biosynthesis